MKRAMLVGFLVVGFTTSSMGAGYLKVGSWNIENLGQRQQNRHALAEHIQLADVDVLALQEIHDTNGAGAPYANNRLQMALDLVNQVKGNDWEYELFPNQNPKNTARLCGVAWNKLAVTKVGDTFRVPLNNQGNTLWDRHPHAVKFAAVESKKTDFVVIPLHMKSNIGGAAITAARRAREAMALGVALPQVVTHFGDSDVILLGDTNCLNSKEEALQTYRSLGFRDLNQEDSQTFAGGAPFDHILVPDRQDEFDFSRQYVMRPANIKSHDSLISDHFLIVTSIRIMDDDDSGSQDVTPMAMPPAMMMMTMKSDAYYQSVNPGLSKDKFRKQLHNLIDDHRTFSYGQLWNALAFTDQDPTNTQNVLLLYTGWSRSRDDHGGAASKWNREHVWAKSRGDFGTRRSAGTDLHHIRPTDVTVNQARGSLPFDEGGDLFNDRDGTTLNRIVRGKSWEPRDEVKGDVARMIFYMAVRYESRPDLEVKETTPPRTSKPEIGRLSKLLQWHKKDLPNTFEKTRNQRVFELQGNRNPFIDHPEWVRKVFE
jgi:endonuclease I/endonuclease/exonuclease/phosphatase family metal-dependent hydrolase